jgi:hypothetical protein
MSELDLSALTADSAWVMVRDADSPEAKYQAAQYAISEWYRAKTGNPIPQLYRDLPQAEDSSGAVESILTHLIMADDLEAATDVEAGRSLTDIVDKPVIVSRIAWRESDVEGDGWGAYVLLECSVDGAAPEVYSTSAKQVVTVLWRCYCMGWFPVRGYFRLLGNKRAGRDQPIGFQVESGF